MVIDEDGSWDTNQGEATPNSPKAYLNWIFFDEQFNYVASNSGAMHVKAIPNGSPNTSYNFSEAVIPTTQKNGYVYVFLNNESGTTPVFFDNFDVTHTRGVIIEDNAYYPYGLKIAGISSRAAMKPITKEGYQGDYTEHDEETGYDEFALRSYDAQIGRWIQNDPYDEYASMYSNVANDPVNKTDPTGGCEYCETWQKALTLENVVVNGAKKVVQTSSSFLSKAGSFLGGTLGGLKDGAVGLFDFATDGAWKKSTWIGMGRATVALGADITGELIRTATLGYVDGQQIASNGLNFVDESLGTQFVATRDGIHGALDKFIADAPNMTAQQWGNFTGQLTFAVLGTKGISVVKNSAVTLAKATLFTETVEIMGAAEKGVAALDGSFSITEYGWQGYPKGIPRPTGTFRLLEGEEYAAARTSANKANQSLSRKLGLKGKEVDIHEIKPVKFGGNPTNVNNKLFLDSRFHETQVNPFWDNIKRGIK